jgi:hypothetical protein
MVYGTNSGGLSGSISRDSSTSNSQQTTHLQVEIYFYVTHW